MKNPKLLVQLSIYFFLGGGHLVGLLLSQPVSLTTTTTMMQVVLYLTRFVELLSLHLEPLSTSILLYT
jgi:hypothetical protein